MLNGSHGPRDHVTVGGMQPIYLDHNATTPMLPAVADVLTQACREGYANPSSQHEAGRRSRRRLEEARERIACLLGASTAGMVADRLLFTSGGTESNNHALRGALDDRPQRQHLIVSAIEHPSVAGLADHLQRHGVEVDRLGVNSHGVARVDQLAGLLRPETRLVSVSLGSHETGVLQPVKEMAALCAAQCVPMHTDATQVVGKLPVDFQDLGVAMLTFSAHKFHGPRGIGGLLVRGDYAPAALLHGQAGSDRPGTPAVELALATQHALDLWNQHREDRPTRMASLRDRFEAAILAGDPEISVVGGKAQRLPHTSCPSFLGLDRQVLQMALDREGVACSTGSACASGSSEPSPSLLAMGLPEEVVRGALRFSLGATTTAAEVDQAAGRILVVSKRLRSRKEE